MPPPPKTGINGPLLLEEPLIRTPYELLRRTHRSAQRQVERDFVALQTQLAGLLKSLTGTESDRDLVLSKLDTAADRVRGLKRKLDDLQPAPGTPSVLRDRIRHVEGAILPPKEDAERSDVEIKVEPEDVGDKGWEAEAGLTNKDRFKEPDADEEVKVEVEVKVEDDKETNGDVGMERTSSPAPRLEDRTLDRYVIDHLLRTGRMKTARTLAAARDIENLVDIKLFAELVRIETALLQKHSVAEALAWCGENRGTLKKLNSNLEFTLRLQEFIELCRRRETTAAIAYARKNLAPWASAHMADVQQGMTLLAFGETTGVPVYRKLYDPARWQVVRAQFRDTFLGIYALPSQSLLALSLSAGLSSLRLPACLPAPAHGSAEMDESVAGRSPGDGPVAIPGTVATTGILHHGMPQAPPRPLLPVAPDYHAMLGMDSLVTIPVREEREDPPPPPPKLPTRNVDCPTCALDMCVLAAEVPMAHHTNSTLVCRISGDVMDSDNVPLAFPNGYVYSSKALAEMAKNNSDIVTCPLTGDTCLFSRLRKVFIT